MVWMVRILKDDRQFTHIVDELRTALAVSCVLLRRGIVVKEIDGPDGEKVSPQVIQECCGDDADAGEWRRARLKFLSR